MYKARRSFRLKIQLFSYINVRKRSNNKKERDGNHWCCVTSLWRSCLYFLLLLLCSRIFSLDHFFLLNDWFDRNYRSNWCTPRSTTINHLCNTTFTGLFHKDSSPCFLRTISYMKKSQDYLQLNHISDKIGWETPVLFHQRNKSKKRLTLVPVLVEAETLQRISLNSSASAAPQRQDAAVCIPPSAASLEHSVPSTHRNITSLFNQ